MIKICRICNIAKPISEFRKSKFGKYGVTTDYKSCFRIFSKKYRKQNRIKEILRLKLYRQNNKHKILEYNKINRRKFNEYFKNRRNNDINDEIPIINPKVPKL